MDQKVIRTTLDNLTEEIRQLDERREKLMTARAGLEALLSLEGGGRRNGHSVPLFDLPAIRGQTQPKGIISLRQAIIQTMEEARGEPLHTSEIVKRALAKGASTDARDPRGVADLMLYSLKKNGFPVQKTAPRTWAWGKHQ